MGTEAKKKWCEKEGSEREERHARRGRRGRKMGVCNETRHGEKLGLGEGG